MERAGAFTPMSTLPWGSWSTLDYNRDGNADFIRISFATLTTERHSIVLGRGNATFDAPPAAERFGPGLVADLNLDDLADRVQSNTFPIGTSGQRQTVNESVLSWTMVK